MSPRIITFPILNLFKTLYISNGATELIHVPLRPLFRDNDTAILRIGKKG